VNALLQQNRVICGPMPGLTRDAISVEWTFQNRPVKIVDTAGIRKVTKRVDCIEDLAVQDAMRAMKVADVAVLVLDAQARKLGRQELAIADAVVKEGRALVVVANKQDLIVTQKTTPTTKKEKSFEYSPKDFKHDVQTQLEGRIPLLRKTPVITMSSLYQTNVDALMPTVFQARKRWERVIPTGTLNHWLRDVMVLHPPPMQNGRPTKIKYIIQTKGRPPTFLLFTNNNNSKTTLPESYLRYLIRNFQDTFEYFGMEIRLSIKASAPRNPYVSSRGKSASASKRKKRSGTRSSPKK
jgi:GTPase